MEAVESSSPTSNWRKSSSSSEAADHGLSTTAPQGTAVARPSLKPVLIHLALLIALLGPPLPGSAQTPVVGQPDRAADTAVDLAPLRARLEAATTVFYSADQPDAIPPLGDLITDLTDLCNRQTDGPATEAARDLLAEILFLRAEAWKNLAEEEASEEDLRRLLGLVPSFQADPVRTSPVLLEALEVARRRTVGRLRIEADPIDLELSVDRRDASPGVELLLTAGHHRLSAARPGYQATEIEIDVTAGSLGVLPVVLERTSAVLTIPTWPDDAEVLLAGRVVGRTILRTAPSTATDASPELASKPPQPEAALVIDGLEPGRHEVEVRKNGYRTRRLAVEIHSLSDYRLDPVILEPTEAFLILAGLPHGASLSVDGKPLEVLDDETVRQTLPAGEHRIDVALRPIGAFHETVDLADRETLEVEIALRPIVALVGILGGTESTSSRIAGEIRSAFGDSNLWHLHDCAESAQRILVEHQIAAVRLRRVAAGGRVLSSLKSWDSTRQDLDSACGASIYLLAVLSDDIYATWVDLWLWPAVPAVAASERLRIGLETEVPGLPGMADLAATLSRPLRLERPGLGARFIDSEAATGPVVLEVTTGGPAAQAGLAVGDEILMADGETLDSCRQLRSIVSTLPAGSELVLQANRAGERHDTTIRVENAPVVQLLADMEGISATLAAQLAVEASRPTPSVAPWLLELNRSAALIRLGAWREAVLTLREIEIPPSQGDQQALADYLLGRALLGADPNAYEARAREAFARAAGSTDGRLYHRDGTPLQPLARFRSEAPNRP